MFEGATAPALAAAATRLAAFQDRLDATSQPKDRSAWESDRAGRVAWSEGTRAFALGELIAVPGGPVARAFAQRRAFRHIDDQGVALSGVPFFDTDGRFCGYRGTRAPAPSRAEEASLFDTGASVDAFARLAHEVRTPLTAIMGFAQMIEAETLGTAGAEYCERAGAIVESATRLLEAVDDLADAAQLEQGRYVVEDGRCDIAAMLADLAAEYKPAAERASVLLSVLADPPLPAEVDERLIRRALARVLASILAAAQNELLTIGARRDGADIEILFARPAALEGLAPATLLDPSNRIPLPGAAGPLLGLGFGLRLAERLIGAVGGRFAIDAESIRIRLPGIAKRDHIA